MAVAAPALLPPAAVGQSSIWSPDRPVRLIVPFAPGGSQDVLGRLFAQVLTPIVPQQVVIEKRAGAGGILGAETVARAAPDGHALLLATAGQLTIAKAIGRRLPYDPIADFTPVAHVTDSPVALLAASQLGVETMPALLARATAAIRHLPTRQPGSAPTLRVAIRRISWIDQRMRAVVWAAASPAYFSAQPRLHWRRAGWRPSWRRQA